MSRDVLHQAEMLQRDAALQGFDWTNLADLWPKLDEEIAELKEAVAQSVERQQDELGDLLFMVVNIARHLGLDPAAALAGATAKFASRYAYVIADEAALPPLGDPARLDAMEARWRQAKRLRP